MANKPTDFTVVHAKMKGENVTSVLSRNHERITGGDLQGAQGIVLLLMDADGFTCVDKSDALTERDAWHMICIAAHAMTGRFSREDGFADGYDDAG